MEVDEGSDQKSDIQPHWMAAHVCLKNAFLEDVKYHVLNRWLKIIVFEYRNDPKFSDRQVWTNSADPDQTTPREAV